MTEHTPVPWNVNGSAIEADDVTIAHVYDPDDNGPDEYAANASLMSAAPDLLDALERLIHMAECNTTPGPNTLAQARAAIKKATGQS